MEIDTTVVPVLVDAPANFTTLGVAAFVGWNGPFWADTNLAFVDFKGKTGGTALEGIARSNTEANIKLVSDNVPGTFLIGNEYWYIPSTLDVTDANGRKFSFPAGAMLVRETQGASAYTPPAPTPAVVMKIVLGQKRPLSMYVDEDGNMLELQSCTAFNGTTIPKGKLVQVTSTNISAINPGTPMPSVGDYVEMVQVPMGQAIVFMGPNPAAKLQEQQG